MSNPFLDRLVGLIIARTEVIHDYLQIYFSDGTIINLYNAFYVDGKVQPQEDVLHSLSGQKITEASLTTDLVRIRTSDGHEIEVLVGDDDYVGPEAMELFTTDNTHIVWNA